MQTIKIRTKAALWSVSSGEYFYRVDLPGGGHIEFSMDDGPDHSDPIDVEIEIAATVVIGE